MRGWKFNSWFNAPNSVNYWHPDQVDSAVFFRLWRISIRACVAASVYRLKQHPSICCRLKLTLSDLISTEKHQTKLLVRFAALQTVEGHARSSFKSHLFIGYVGFCVRFIQVLWPWPLNVWPWSSNVELNSLNIRQCQMFHYHLHIDEVRRQVRSLKIPLREKLHPMLMSMSKTFMGGGAVCREFESEAPVVEQMLDQTVERMR